MIMNKIKIISIIVTFFISAFSIKVFAQFGYIAPLNSFSISQNTSEKPQSKVWKYDNKWWCVMPMTDGTHVYRLDDNSWTDVLKLTDLNNTHADCIVDADVVHIFLYSGILSHLISIEYVQATQVYIKWTVDPTLVNISLDTGVQTGTIDMEGHQGRMWLSSDGNTQVYVRWSDYPYIEWGNDRIQINDANSSCVNDDMCAVTAFTTSTGGKIGVLWSDQDHEKFWFRYHKNSDPVGTWQTQEVAASGSTYSGVGDNHMNFAVASNGTIYAAVKTSYDDPNDVLPEIAMLVRRPAGTWDDIYDVTTGSGHGTRPIVLLNETKGIITVVYTDDPNSPHRIRYKQTAISSISFGSQFTLIGTSSTNYNNPTSTKQNYTDEVVILASNSGSAVGVIAYTSLLLTCKVFLQGPFNNGVMTTDLNSLGIIPLNQPYNTGPWNYSGTESVSSIPSNIVDWVLIELRNTYNGSSVGRRAAFLKNDGSIVDLDGSSPVKFSTISDGDYYIVVRHRNHLAVMSATAQSFSTGAITDYDFTTAQSKAYGTNAMKDLLGNATVFGMFGGNGNGDGFITASDKNISWFQQNGSIGYFSGDFNLNTFVTAGDKNLIWFPNNGLISQVP
jgi:hypothetical protein